MKLKNFLFCLIFLLHFSLSLFYSVLIFPNSARVKYQWLISPTSHGPPSLSYALIIFMITLEYATRMEYNEKRKEINWFAKAKIQQCGVTQYITKRLPQSHASLILLHSFKHRIYYLYICTPLFLFALLFPQAF